ncbi:50S ribosomal protein L23 [Polystyrenella longa]|uniref:Large ribosomal subunit protein uL23 n=1 Tax=Polystyrenella longa TaxID=2528007 RepID=A0A518CR94_9PLAN|nr:50S ribosomal protein L23 [Polystyrenella longa]QDU81747.1 50S ribosomal protein L23 [Polystyrenella longa]
MSAKTSGITLEPHQVVLKPLVTEKGTHISEKYNTYTFAVHSDANKTDIKKAVETLWGVKVIGVRTQNHQGKTRRHKMMLGKTKSWKKAFVQLHDDDRISFF